MAVRPYVGGGVGALNLRRTIREVSRGNVTTAYLAQFGAGDGVVDITQSNTTKPMAEVAAGIGAVIGHGYVDVEASLPESVSRQSVVRHLTGGRCRRRQIPRCRPIFFCRSSVEPGRPYALRNMRNGRVLAHNVIGAFDSQARRKGLLRAWCLRRRPRRW